MTENPTTPAINDVELMEKARNGDLSAFAVIVKRHQQPLMNFFRRMGVYTDAEDMVQETMVRLFRYRDRYRPTAKFTTFLYLLARQVRLDHLRKEVRRDELTRELRSDFAEDSLLAEEPYLRIGYDVEDCLSVLADEMREIVVLNIYQGLTYAEIAEALEIPVGTVKSRMFYALKKMRDRLDEQRKSGNQ